jgi:hypothetical protein
MKKLLLKTLAQMSSGEIVKKNGFIYSEKTIKFYSDVINSLKFEKEDILKNIQSQLQKRGASSVTEKNYLDCVRVLMTKSGIEFKDVKTKVYQPTIHIPEPERVWKMIREFEPATKQERWGFRFLATEFLTSARYADLSKLDQSNIHSYDGKEYLVYQQSKTGKKVSIPITPLLKSQFSATGYLLPKIPYSSLIKYVKKVYQKAGFTREVKSVKLVAGEMVEVTMKEFEAFGTHRMRGCSITSMLQNGMTELEAKQISGHSPKSQSFSRYVEFSQNHMNEKYLKFMR